MRPTRTADAVPAPAQAGRRAFSIGEIMVIVVILGAFAAVVAPQFAGATEDERTSNAEVVIAGIRSAVSIYTERARARGTDPYPSLADLSTPGVVTMRPLPSNPFTGVRGVQAVTRTQAENRAVFETGRFGWNYFFDNSGDEPTVHFYANCRLPTTVPDGEGSTLTANEL